MSRISKNPIDIPNGVEVTVNEKEIKVKGPKGELTQEYLPYVKFVIEDNKIKVEGNESAMKRKSDAKKINMFQGTYASLVKNMIKGVTEGFTKELEIIGIGYRAKLQGSTLVLELGYSHPIEYIPPEGITIEVPAPNKVIVKGIDKYLVGEVAAKIKRFRKPNVYSGKGIKYVGEVIIRKQGKKV
ncbi:50S ribosomal protein L6 [Marinitoga sp. 1135]|uniref:Large ribosomal subunit protein uL6 n=1 Tax=Marinitoga piezophila (strain DSM 14283 / JCM 11233 / KA3) TaxID=443254 RepID=H2J789_MARPK|nr:MULTISPECIES: 50S ribosomal protein L6 [Marinitoga]AEX85281.1 ribosomal protein L6, bacterial type [Marinitoga piezophila KA3]APT75766.1 50S ribosomal protein L6 [Marinitoga sp. 1137]NUU95507.1 50S ribosomal protein L6 [Marinitoga sp. 1135]NUU97434.1 50S ribosomal protein L6 [Marinitoga sp. 1138]